MPFLGKIPKLAKGLFVFRVFEGEGIEGGPCRGRCRGDGREGIRSNPPPMRFGVLRVSFVCGDKKRQMQKERNCTAEKKTKKNKTTL